VNPELAWHQFQLPFDHQDPAGTLPDSVAHSEVLHNFVKPPPVHGWALGHLRRLLPRPPHRRDDRGLVTRAGLVDMGL
jgi:hypothetical protein